MVRLDVFFVAVLIADTLSNRTLFDHGTLQDGVLFGDAVHSAL